MPATTIARAASSRGEVVLRQRDDGALELRVNGVFVMDTLESSSESALADHVLSWLEARDRLPGAGRSTVTRVLVGGLGLGFTLRRLARAGAVDEIVVVEIEGALIDWHRRGLVPVTADVIHDPRLRLVEADVRAQVAGMPPESLDAIVLDVDNGPGFLVYDDNARVYQAPFLADCHRALASEGVLLVWSADEAVELEATLRTTFGNVECHSTEVTLGTRDECYFSYAATKARRASESCPAR